MRFKVIAKLSACFLAFAPPCHAASWHTVDRHDGERIEIDKSRIARVDAGKTLAWSRLVFGRELPLGEGDAAYSAIEALNRYDCTNRRFMTVRRVYLREGRPVRQEAISAPREMDIVADSVDAHLLTEACRPRTVGELRETVEATNRAVLAAQPVEEAPAKAMYADMRRLADDKPVRLRAVSDTSVKADASPPSAGKIELPSRAELAAKAAADKATLMPPPAATAPSAVVTAPVAPPAAPVLAPSPHSAPSYARFTRKKNHSAEIRPAVGAEVAPHAHWSYEGEGAPAHWGKLGPDYALCASGKRQSPIDIREGIRVDLEPIRFDYRPTHFRIVDNGHTVQINVGEGSGIDIMGRHFDLVQMHFHRPSEERVNGKSYDMVAHLVHKDIDGQLAVVAILLEKGAEHPVIQTLWNNMPLEVGLDIIASDAIDLNLLLPENRTYWTYMGSLTTPPCSEGVLWMVLKQPQQISSDQVAIFSRLYRNNARPVQPSNNRLIKESR